MENFKYYIAAFLGGLVAKMYDDINDNEKLIKYKSEFLLELLKGLHYIFFLLVSFRDPFFYIISVINNALHGVFNSASYEKSYELSVLIVFGLYIFYIDYTNINFNNVYNILKKSIVGIILFGIIEPYFVKEEVSLIKLVSRVILIILCILGLNDENYMVYLSLYGIGYFLFSVIVQYYCLYVNVEICQEKNEEICQEKNEEICQEKSEEICQENNEEKSEEKSQEKSQEKSEEKSQEKSE